MEQNVESSSDPQLNQELFHYHQSRLKGSQTRKWSREEKDRQRIGLHTLYASIIIGIEKHIGIMLNQIIGKDL